MSQSSDLRKPVVYLMGPYTKGDPAINTHCQYRLFFQLLEDGLVTPYAPLTSHLLHLIRPTDYHEWIDHDLSMIQVCDAGLRQDAEYRVRDLNYIQRESKGADLEEEEFRRLGKPHFKTITELYFWAQTDWEAGI